MRSGSVLQIHYLLLQHRSQNRSSICLAVLSKLYVVIIDGALKILEIFGSPLPCCDLRDRCLQLLPMFCGIPVVNFFYVSFFNHDFSTIHFFS